jgi:hypothetical protein
MKLQNSSDTNKGFTNLSWLMEGSGPVQIAADLDGLKLTYPTDPKPMGPRTTFLSVFLQIPYGVVHQIRNVF